MNTISLERRYVRLAFNQYSKVILAVVMILYCTIAKGADVQRTTINDLFNLSLKELMKMPVTVASQRQQTVADAPSIITVLTKADIRSFGARSLVDVINLLPSTQVIREVQRGMVAASVRGDLNRFASHQLFLINGESFRDIPDPLRSTQSLLTSFPVDSIERVEFIRGPGSVIYGTNAYTGVFNIVTRSQKSSVSQRLSLSSSEHNKHRAAFQFRDKRGYINAQTTDYQGWQTTDINAQQQPRRIGSGHQSSSLDGNWQYRSVDLTVYMAKQNYQVFNPSLLQDTSPLISDLYYLQAGWHFGDVVEPGAVSLSVLKSDEFRAFPIVGRFNSESDSWVANGHKSWQLREFHWLFGGNVYYSRHEAINTNNPDLTLSTLSYRLYSQVEFNPTDNSSFTFGLQHDTTESGASKTTPKASYNLQIGEQWLLKFSSGQAFRSATGLERSIDISPFPLVGNPDLEPETITTHELHLAYQYNSLQTTASIFYNQQSNLIVELEEPENNVSFVNLGKLSQQGVELTANWRPQIQQRQFTLFSSLLYQEIVNDSKGNSNKLLPETLFKWGGSLSLW